MTREDQMFEDVGAAEPMINFYSDGENDEDDRQEQKAFENAEVSFVRTDSCCDLLKAGLSNSYEFLTVS